MISIQLSDEEAELFKQFREHQRNYQTLKNKGFWQFKKITVQVNFNAIGIVTMVNPPDLTKGKENPIILT